MRHRPKVIISDLSMPEMDGYELLGHVRQLAPEQGGDAPMIAVTGRSDAKNGGKRSQQALCVFSRSQWIQNSCAERNL